MVHKVGSIVFVILCLSISKGYAGLDHPEEFEGWVQRKSLNFTLPNRSLTFINADAIHQDMADLTEHLQKDIISNKNIAVVRLGLVLEDNRGYQSYSLVPCLDDYIFFSGQATPEKEKVFISQDQLMTGIKLERSPIPLKQYIINEPQNYSFSLEEIKRKLQRRFSPTEEQATCISKVKYTGQFLEKKIQDSFQGGKPSERLKKIAGIIEDFEGRHSDSEQKILFFLNEGLRDIPFYWNHRLFSLIKEVFPHTKSAYAESVTSKESELLEEFLAQELQSLSTLSIGDTLHKKVSMLMTLQDEGKKASTKSKAPQLKKPPIETKKEELKVPDTLPFLYQELKRVQTLRKENPLKQNIASLQEDEENFSHLNNFFSQEPRGYWKAEAKYIQDEIIAREELYPIWIKSLFLFLDRLPKNVHIKGFVLHLHSWRDICGHCAVALTRESELKGGFIDKLKSIFASHNANQFAPFFRLLTSCSEVRSQERFNKHTDEHSREENYLIPIEPVGEKENIPFFQKHIESKTTKT